MYSYRELFGGGGSVIVAKPMKGGRSVAWPMRMFVIDI